MASSRRLITSTTLSSSASSVTFSSIPSTYTDLCIKGSVRTDRVNTVDLIDMLINSNSSSVYSYTFLSGNGTSATSGSGSSGTIGYGPWVDADSSTSSTFGSFEIYIPSYTASQNKPYSIFPVTENNATYGLTRPVAGLFSSTTAISSISFTSNAANNFLAGSTFQLYGILNS